MRILRNVMKWGFVWTLLLSMSLSAFAAELSVDSQRETGIENALRYLHAVQNKDGGFPAREGRESSSAVTSWVIMALASAGEDSTADEWKPNGESPIDYLVGNDYAFEETTDYARLILAMSAADLGTVHKGIDLADKIRSFQNSDGQFAQGGIEDEMINSHMWAVLALASAEVEIPKRDLAREWLISRQNADGGFAWAIGLESDTDDTAIAIQTLILLGEDPESSPAISRALTFISEHQNADGGFSSSQTMGMDSNVASTSWIIQAIYAAKDIPDSNFWTLGDVSPMTYLMSMQGSDGSFQWKQGVNSSPVQMTAYAIMAMNRTPFPVTINNDGFGSSGKIFSDFDQSHSSYGYVMELVKAGIISGYPDGTFKPENPVQRGEFTSLIINGLGYEMHSAHQKMTFKDVPDHYWAYRYIAIASDLGIISGRDHEIFDPYGKITGAELATMLVNCLPQEQRADIVEGPFWYSGNVALAMKKDLLYPEFNVLSYASREQCADSIYRIRALSVE